MVCEFVISWSPDLHQTPLRETDLNVRAQMFVLCIGLMRNWDIYSADVPQ